MVNKDEYII